MNNGENAYFESIYNDTIDSIYKLCVAKDTLSYYGLLTYDEKCLLRKGICVLCKKVVMVEKDIEELNTSETEDIPLPESEVEFTEGVM